MITHGFYPSTKLALASFYEDGAEDESGILPQPERPPVPEISRCSSIAALLLASRELYVLAIVS